MLNKCHFCGQTEFAYKKVEYIYRYRQQYMVFREVPAEVCLHCGMRYYSAEIVLELEQRFFAVQRKESLPANTITIPVETFAHMH